MFKKLFGSRSNRSKKKNKKRLSPSALSPDGRATTHPLYQYAMKEYAQTVPHVDGTMDADGKIRPTFSMNQDDESIAVADDIVGQQEQPPLQQSRSNVDVSVAIVGDSSAPPPPPPLSHSPPRRGPGFTPSPSILRFSSYKSDVSGLASAPKAYQKVVFSPRTEYVLSNDFDDNDDLRSSYNSPHSHSQQQQQQQQQPSQYSKSIHFEPPMPDSTYEEWYGDAYLGGPIKYIYPSGYQSMRPRSGPWKLSIVVCLLFTWLSVFIIGHCSDKAAEQYGGFYNYNSHYNKNNNKNDDGSSSSSNGGTDDGASQEQHQYFDTNTNDIDTKWCGSVLLYWMWVISMLITGLATAYCSVIGYIKVRDFAVANSRSQPPGVVVGKSDYYVQISSGHQPRYHPPPPQGGQPVHPSQYQPTIYQADGTPQFWGNQIYRPTQAAVAITSR
jgi:hypothetical protein